MAKKTAMPVIDLGGRVKVIIGDKWTTLAEIPATRVNAMRVLTLLGHKEGWLFSLWDRVYLSQKECAEFAKTETHNVMRQMLGKVGVNLKGVQ